jgi:hypothetical protein
MAHGVGNWSRLADLLIKQIIYRFTAYHVVIRRIFAEINACICRRNNLNSG